MVLEIRSSGKLVELRKFVPNAMGHFHYCDVRTNRHRFNVRSSLFLTQPRWTLATVWEGQLTQTIQSFRC